MSLFGQEPAVLIGLAATIIVGALQQISDSGVVGASGIQIIGVLVSIVPVIAGLIIRGFVTPVASPAPTPPPAP